MRVYIVRHGESETNRAGLWTGWLDAALTEGGEEDARRAGRWLSGVSFDAVYASDLSRAKRTAELALPHFPYTETPALREINVGSLAGKPLTFLTDEEKKNAAGGYERFGGESREAFCQRIDGFRRGLEGLPYESIAVFSHAGVLRTLVDLTVGVTLSRAKVLCQNCAIAILDFEKEWRLHSWINLS